jgi:hypothetical protein
MVNVVKQLPKYLYKGEQITIGWLEEYQSAVVLYQHGFEQRNKYELLVFTLGLSFSIG